MHKRMSGTTEQSTGTNPQGGKGRKEKDRDIMSAFEERLARVNATMSDLRAINEDIKRSRLVE